MGKPKGYAPQHRHIKAGPKAESQTEEFRLKAGRRVRGRVVDQAGEPVPGACVVLNRWHVHTDRDGFFHWSVEAPVPERIAVKVSKRYVATYKPYQANVALSRLVRQPIVLEK